MWTVDSRIVRVCPSCFCGGNKRPSSVLLRPSAAPHSSPLARHVSIADVYVPVSDRVIPPVERLDGAAFTYVHAPVSRGSTPSAGVFTRDSKTYYGKGIVTDGPAGLHWVLSEVCANDIYAFFGVRAQQLCVSDQRWLPGSERFARELDVTHGAHLMSAWIDSFTVFGPSVVAHLKGECSSALLVPLPGDIRVPVVGLGHILAVGTFLADVDCLGSTGANVGYTVLRDDSNRPAAAQAIKIDPGMAFHLCDVPSNGRRKARKELQQGLVRLSTSVVVPWSSLPPEVKVEYLTTMRDVLGVTPEVMARWFLRDGLQPLFPDAAAVAQRVSFLQERLSILSDLFQSVVPLSPIQSHEECVGVLRQRYQGGVVMKDPVTGAEFTVSQRAVNLALVHDVSEDGDGSGGNQASSSLQALRQGNKRELDVREVMGRCVGVSRRVNVLGGAGYGKSTCCLLIVSEWCAGRWFQEFNWLLYVPLRHLTSDRFPSGDVYDLIDIICIECFGRAPSRQFREVIVRCYDPITTLWVLDGYDEVVGRVPNHLSAAFEQLLSTPNRMLTGRPSALSSLPADLVVELMGFTDGDISSFVSQFCADAPSAGTLLHSLRRQPFVWELAHVPVNLILLCHIFHTAAGVGDSAAGVTTLTTVYTEVDMLMLRRYCHRRGDDVSSLLSHADLLSRTEPLRRTLAAVALQSTVAGVSMLSGASILTCFQPALTWDDITDSGILVRVEGSVDDPAAARYEFVHQTMQEYYAAHAVISACDTGNGSVLSWLRDQKYCYSMEVVWTFVSGLLAHAPAHVPAVFGAVWLSEPRDVTCHREVHQLIRVIEEGQLHRLSDPTVRSLVSLCDTIVCDVLERVLCGVGSLAQYSLLFTSLKNSGVYLHRLFTASPSLSSTLLCALTDEGRPQARYDAVDLLRCLRQSMVDVAGIPQWIASSLSSVQDDARLISGLALRELGPAVLRHECIVTWLKSALCLKVGSRRAAVSCVASLPVSVVAETPWLQEWCADGLCVSPPLWTAVQSVKGFGPLMLSAWPMVPLSQWLRECVMGDKAALGVEMLCSLAGSCLTLSWFPAWLLDTMAGPGNHDDAIERILEAVGPAATSIPGVLPFMSIVVDADSSQARFASRVLPRVAPDSVGDVEVRAWINRLCAHEESPIRVLGVSTLLRYGPERWFLLPDLPTIVVNVIQFDPSWDVLRCALDVVLACPLLSMGLLPGLPAAVTRVLQHSEWDIVLRAATVVLGVGADALQYPDVVNAMSGVCDDVDMVFDVGLAWFAKIGPQATAVPWLLPWLRGAIASAASALKSKAVHVLSRIGRNLVNHNMFFQLLLDMSVMSDVTSQAVAWQTISCVGLPSLSNQCLVIWLETRIGAGAAREALDCLVHLSPGLLDRPRLLSLLTRCLDSASPLVQRGVLNVLASCGCRVLEKPVLVEWLEGMLVSGNAAIRLASVSLLTTLFSTMSSGVRVSPACFSPHILAVLSMVAAVTLKQSDGTRVNLFTPSLRVEACVEPCVIAALLSLSTRAGLCGLLLPSPTLSDALTACAAYTWSSETGCGELVAWANTFPYSEQVSLAFSSAVSRVTGGDALAAVGKDVVPLLFTLIAIHESEAVIVSCCDALRALGEASENKSRIGRGGGLGTLASIVAEHSSPSVAASACAAIAAIAFNSPENKSVFVSSGGIGLLLACAATHRCDARVQTACCALLANLASGNVECKEAIVRSGGFSALYAAMDDCGRTVAVAEQACRAIRNLCLEMPSHQSLAATSGGVPRLYAAMSTHADVPGVVDPACGALRNISLSIDGRACLLTTGAVQRLQAARERHAGHTNIRRWATEALGNLH